MNLTRKLLYFSSIFNCFTLISCHKYSNIFNLANTESDSTITCVKNIARKYFPCGTVVTLVNLDKDINQLIQSITFNNCINVILKSSHMHDWLVWTNAYIITSENVPDFSSTISQLTRDILWNPRGKFVLVMQHLDLKEIADIFTVCIRYNIYNLLLLALSGKETFMYTYHSFNDGKCGSDADIVKLGPCNETNDMIGVFSDKVPTTLRNCTFRVIASEDIPNFISSTSNFTVNGKPVLGLEQYIFQIIQEREGITFNYTLTTDDHNVVLSNGSATGQLKYLQEDKSDIAAGGCFLTQNRLQMFAFTGAHSFASFSVFTPKVGESVWKDVYREFSNTTWILILFSFCLVTIICFNIHNLTVNSTQDNHLLLDLWGSLCGNTSTNILKNKKLKIIMICWLWFSFFIANFYNTALYSLITRRVNVKSHIKLENLDELPYQPCIPEFTRTYFLFVYSKDLPIGEYYPECQKTDTVLRFIASRNDLYTIDMDYTYIVQEFHIVDDEGIPKLDTYDFFISTIMGFYVTRGFVFEDKIHQYTNRMHQNGLLSKHLTMIFEQIKSTARSGGQRKLYKKIRLPDLRIHFCVLLFGYVISVICLTYEIKNKK